MTQIKSPKKLIEVAWAGIRSGGNDRRGHDWNTVAYYRCPGSAGVSPAKGWQDADAPRATRPEHGLVKARPITIPGVTAC